MDHLYLNPSNCKILEVSKYTCDQIYACKLYPDSPHICNYATYTVYNLLIDKLQIGQHIIPIDKTCIIRFGDNTNTLLAACTFMNFWIEG